MKIYSICSCMLLTLFINAIDVKNNTANDTNTMVPILSIQDSTLFTILDKIFTSSRRERKPSTPILWKENAIYIIKNYSSGDSLFMKMAIIDKSDFSWYLDGKKDSVLGYFEFNNRSVIVFGSEHRVLFNKTNALIDLPYLEVKPIKIIPNNKEIPPLPVYFEPQVWNYFYKISFILLEIADFEILD